MHNGLGWQCSVVCGAGHKPRKLGVILRLGDGAVIHNNGSVVGRDDAGNWSLECPDCATSRRLPHMAITAAELDLAAKSLSAAGESTITLARLAAMVGC